MQIAVISDIHGNWPALTAALSEIERLGPNLTICLGDTVDPLPSSKRVLEHLFGLNMPLLRGNHEDYIITSFENPAHELSTHPRFRPIQLVSNSFDKTAVSLMKNLPLTYTVHHEMAGDLLFCHASPRSNARGWKYGINDELAHELRATTESMIIGGHWHEPQTTLWQGKTLITTGSVGLPLAGEHAAQFLILEATAHGAWRHEHRAAPYDAEAAIDEYCKSSWFHQGAPISWLFMSELLLAKRTIGPFFRWLGERARSLRAADEWASATKDYLVEAGDWRQIERFKPHFENKL